LLITQLFILKTGGDMLLKNRIALITGSSRGIGASTAKLFAEQGASVAVNYNKSENAAKAVLDEIKSKGGNAIAVKADVTDFRQVEKMVNIVTEKLGPVDTLVINASMKFKYAPFLEQEWEDFESKILGEVKSFFNPCKLIIPSMIERHNGCIITISSGLSKRPGNGFIAHSAAKAALNMLSNSLAHELAPYGIRVNAVAPGLTLTDATSWHPENRKKMMAAANPMRRLGQPEDLAGAVLFLASNYAGYINGGYLPVDGGITTL
jgi:3-oxoacyl-[acyl-carrier protein] reductase